MPSSIIFARNLFAALQNALFSLLVSKVQATNIPQPQ